VVVDAVNHGRIHIVTARSGNHHLLRAALQMCRRLRLRREQTGALENDVDAQIPPGSIGRIGLRKYADTSAIDYHRIAVDFDLSWEFPVDRVIAREVHVRLGIAQIVERYDLHLSRALALISGAQDVASDATVTIDANLYRHDNLFP